MKQSYAGPSAGTGAISRWKGKAEVGEGSNTIVESRANELIRLRLAFIKPFAGTNDVEFSFQPDNRGTLVTWTMTGRLNFMTKALHLVMNMDQMVGGQFSFGLESLRKIVEASPAANPPIPAP